MPYRLEWPVWESYRVVNTDGALFVRPEGKKTKILDIGNEPTLPTELARVNRPWGTKLRPLIEEIKRTHPKESMREKLDERRIRALIDFMEQFGYLGQTILEGRPRKIGRELVDGDDLVWAFSHADNVDACLSLLAMLRNQEWNRMRQFFQTPRARLFPVITPPFYASAAIRRVSTDARRGELESAARRLLETLIDPNLEGVKRHCDGKESRFEFVAPIQVIYWRVADLAGSPYLRQCVDCNTVFFASDARQIFCPPPQGIRESRCARRYRMREIRKSIKGGENEREI